MKKIFALLLSVAMVTSLFVGVAFATVPTTTILPANAATGVPINVNPAIIFSEAVQGFGGAALTPAYLAASISLTTTAAPTVLLPFTASISENARVITVLPSAVLAANTSHTITVLANRFERLVSPHGVVAEVSSAFTTTATLPSTAALITGFSILGVSGVIDNAPAGTAVAPRTIAVTVPHGTTVTALVPTIGISPNATVSPLSNVAQNFTSPVLSLIHI